LIGPNAIVCAAGHGFAGQSGKPGNAALGIAGQFQQAKSAALTGHRTPAAGAGAVISRHSMILSFSAL
jgi:hypothetical protein